MLTTETEASDVYVDPFGRIYLGLGRPKRPQPQTRTEARRV